MVPAPHVGLRDLLERCADVRLHTGLVELPPDSGSPRRQKQGGRRDGGVRGEDGGCLAAVRRYAETTQPAPAAGPNNAAAGDSDAAAAGTVSGIAAERDCSAAHGWRPLGRGTHARGPLTSRTGGRAACAFESAATPWFSPSRTAHSVMPILVVQRSDKAGGDAAIAARRSSAAASASPGSTGAAVLAAETAEATAPSGGGAAAVDAADNAVAAAAAAA
ncbi:unnamed protein product, partial [Phaeothamnion confervicola]